MNGSEMPRQACVDALFRLPVIISGRFEPGNQFKIQVRYPYHTEIVAELPATLVGDFLEFTFKNAQLYERPVIEMRIVASAPKTEGFWFDQTFNVYSKGSIGLTQVEYSDTLNLYDDYKFRIAGYNTSIAWATLNDSSRIELPSNGHFSILHQIVISKEGPLAIAHAKNECGAMTISGSLRPVVNKTSIKTLSVDPQAVCEGAEVKIGFSVAGPALPAQTRYRIRFSDTNPDDAKPNSLEVPAQLQEGYLVARVPDNLSVTFRGGVVAQVVTDHIVASKSNKFWVAPKASATFGSQNQTINFGESRFLYLDVKGLPPLSVTLSDGTTTNLGEQGQLLATVRPDQTTSYSIKSISSGCSNAASLNNDVLQIKVNPGIRFANEKDRQIFCGGSKASVKFVSNAALTSSTQFWIEAKHIYNNADKIRIPATRSGDQLTFDAPNREQGFSEFAYQIITANPALESIQTQLIEIHTMPGMEYHNTNIYDYQIPSNVRVSYMIHGGWPYVVETMEGEKFTDSDVGQYDFYLKQNREFRFKSISNGCFKNENLPAKTFRILGNGNNPAIAFEPVIKLVCANDSLEVTFQQSGNFNAGNQFQVQGMTDCCEFRTLATVSKDGKHKVKFPADRFAPAAQIRIVSTSPVVYSQIQEFFVQLPPEQFRLSREGTPENPIESLPFESYPSLEILAEKGLPARIDYSQNGKDTTFVNTSSQSTTLPISLVPGKVNEFVVKSATNVCGTVPVNLKAYIYPILYRIEPSVGGQYCLGGPISVPFWAVEPMSKPATFSLQIAKEGTTDFTTIATTETGRVLTGKIPANASPGNYKTRIMSSDGMLSREGTILIGTTPTATIGSGSNSEPLVIEPGVDTPLKVTLTGGPDWTVVYEDNSKKNYLDPVQTRTISPVRGGEFFVKSVSNYCGYGTVSGSQIVKVNPSLQLNTTPYNACEGSAFPVNYSLLGDVDLSDDYIRFELVNLETNAITVLDSTKTVTGIRSLNIPNPLPSAKLEIRVAVRKYNLRATLNTLIAQKPGTVLSGNTVINSGETTYIVARNTKDLPDGADVTLSDGTVARIFGMTGELSYIQVSPKQTTTYTIKTIQNNCGTGVASGSATVEVNPASERSITTGVYISPDAGSCAGDEILVSYNTKGTFSAGNKMTVQISDSTGRNFTNIPTTGTQSPLKAVIPLNLPNGRLYRIRVAASDPGVSSSAAKEVSTITQKSKARFSVASVTLDGANAPRVQILLEGIAPWTLFYGSESSARSVTTSNPTYEVELLHAAPNELYRIFSVRSACGVGDVGTPGTVRVEVITGTNEPFSQEGVSIYPNPTADLLILDFLHAAPRSIELFDISGHRIGKMSADSREDHLDISKLPAGTYVVKVIHGSKTSSYRIIKH
ncbi:T9SS type A sorting domain-containing protein [Dyadobacter sp.]